VIHDQRLLELLDAFPREQFSGEVYRATRIGLDALAPSVAGGRWSHRDSAMPTLYTSLSRDGAIAEMAFHLGQLVPRPRKPVNVSRIAVSTRSTVRLLRADLQSLGIDARAYTELQYERTKDIGAAVAFLECDGLIAPSARWDVDNLMLFPLNHHGQDTLRVIDDEVVDWTKWADEHSR
jgi:RES domain